MMKNRNNLNMLFGISFVFPVYEINMALWYIGSKNIPPLHNCLRFSIHKHIIMVSRIPLFTKYIQ